MKEYITAVLLLALAATGTLLSLQTLTQKASATPTGLIVTSPTTSLVKTETRNNTHIYTLQVHVKPLTSLQAEKIACIYGAKVTALNTSVGKATLETNPDSACIFFTIDNPSIKEVEATVLVTAETLLEEKGEPPILLIGALTGMAAASYLTQTESGRDKLFKAISIPVGYYVARHEDVLRSKKRVEILEYLKKEPGASMRRISRDTGISFGEVQWHLSILERLGYVRRARIGKWTVYYPTGSPAEKWLENFISDELGEKITPQTAAALAARLEPYLSTGTIPTSLIREAITK
jgi:DNA-binding transcriptional ArsR family regulator